MSLPVSIYSLTLFISRSLSLTLSVSLCLSLSLSVSLSLWICFQLKTRLTSTWRLTAILRLLTQHTTTTTTTPAFPLPPLLLSYYQLATQHLATSTALSANGAAQHQPAHSPFSPVSSTEVKITSLKPCAPPPMGQTHDPFASSSLLASATQVS